MFTSKRFFPLFALACCLAGAPALAQDPPDGAGGVDPADQADAATQLSPEAAAAKQQFDVVQQEWAELVGQITALLNQRSEVGDGPEREQLDASISELRKQAEEVISRSVDAGLAAYRADPNAFPDINRTLLSIAQFHLTGNSQGDGGDQYEKAFPLIKSLLEAGAGETWPDLWLWGGVAAYCTNEFDLAEQYFARAKEAGLLGANPPTRNPADPRLELWHRAKGFEGDLPVVRREWKREQSIRAAEAEADNLPRVKFQTTRGDIVIELFEDHAPESVANMITLVKQGYYDGVVFHRVIPGFMAQGGDPTGTGRGGPGYNIRDEHTKSSIRLHFRGSLSMAHKGEKAPNSGSSQFFLTFVPTTPLDGKHAVFGRIIEGIDVAASLRRRNPPAPPPHPTPDRIIKAEVLRDRGHAYEFEKLPER